MSEATVLTLQGTELVHGGGPTGYAALSEQTDAKKPFSDPMVYRIDVLEKEARGVLDIITEYARKLASQHVDVPGFEPEPGLIAPAHYRRRKIRVDCWPIAGIIGKTGLSNWKNMVNKAVVAARAGVEMSQNNGTWLCERYETGISMKGREEVLYVDLWFVDARNADDLEWRDGAPVRAEHRRSEQLTASSLVTALRAATAPRKKKGAKAAVVAAPAEEEDDENDDEEDETPVVEEVVHAKRQPVKPLSNADRLPPPPVKA